jgi:amidohydrolase
MTRPKSLSAGLSALTALVWAFPAAAAPRQVAAMAPRAADVEIDQLASRVMPRVIAWRRDFHQNPELGSREFRTAGIVADHLRKLGIEVKTGVAHTGVVGLLRGGRPGPTVALRADMDGLPVVEEVDLPFKSVARSTWMGKDVGVMHACGHDNHVAILMGVAEILATPSVRTRLAGGVKFVFQPAEEGPPPGEEGGASMMVKEGILENPKVDAIFGLHVFPFETGTLAWRARGLMAAGDSFTITIRGRQTHGAMPWAGVDPILVAAQIVTSLQSVVARQTDITRAPAVVTIGTIEGGNRVNIIPDEVKMSGTIRTLEAGVRKETHANVERIVKNTAAAAGATATFELGYGFPVTFNDPALVARIGGTLWRVGGDTVQPDIPPTTTSEDFAYYQEKVPGFFFFLGVTPRGTPRDRIFPNHSPRFFADEAALITGVRAMANLALDYGASR